MEAAFRALAEDTPGPRWAAHARHVWAAYRAWYLGEGDGARPGYLTCQQALARHMPELVPVWERLVALAGGGDLAARLLSLYRPPPYLAGCSQLAWTRGDEPALIRNYDYHPERLEGLMLRSAWRGAPVIAMVDSLWGALDGINAHGLAVTLAFSGRQVVGDGFGIPLLVRYVLETCATTADAVAALRRVPSHMAYTVTALDAAGAHATVHVAPDHAAEVDAAPLAANDRGATEWPGYATLTRSEARRAVLAGRLAADDETLDGVIARFGEPPLFSDAYTHGFGTLYTAVYRPRARAVELRWPLRSWHQTIGRFVEGVASIEYDSGDGGDDGDDDDDDARG